MAPHLIIRKQTPHVDGWVGLSLPYSGLGCALRWGRSYPAVSRELALRTVAVGAMAWLLSCVASLPHAPEELRFWIV